MQTYLLILFFATAIRCFLFLFVLETKHLASINNQIPKPFPCGNKLPDNDSDQSKPDIYFHNAIQVRDIRRQDHFV